MKRKNRRQKSDGSLNKYIPTITEPAAPIPVHTAYAVPIGRVCTALLSRMKLRVMQIKNPILHFKFEKLLESLRQVVKPTSNKPPAIKYIQAILLNIYNKRSPAIMPGFSK
jgi:hypothetical protein